MITDVGAARIGGADAMHISDYSYDDDLFATNIQPFASYLEPARWDELSASKSVGDKQVAPRCPATDALARALESDVAQRRQWGYHLAHGGWATVTQDEPLGHFLVKFDDRGGRGSYWAEPRAKPLSYKELRRALIGRSLAVGSTDRPVADRYGVLRAERATCIRIDTDQDQAWVYERHEDVFAELRAQERAVHAMGLPYLVFRTGGRGVQCVVRLPAPLLTATASLLSRGLRMTLRGRADLAGVHVDKDAYDGLMRLPGGLHSRGRTGLFIDVAARRLHPISMQAALLADCLAPTGDGSHGLGPQEALDAQLALLPHLRAVLGSAAKVATEADVLRIVKRAPSNPLCQAVLQAHAALGVPFGKIVTLSAAPKALGRSGLASCDRAWAQAVWAMSIAPGTYWDWVHMGGHRGMLAAVVQFGEANALDRLQDKAASHRAASPRDQAEREHVNRSLWNSFKLKHFVPRARRIPLSAALPTAESTANLARSVAARAKAADPGSKWSEETLAATVEALLSYIEASEEGEAILSWRDIRDLVNERRGASGTNHVRVGEALGRVCQGPTALNFLPDAHHRPSTVPLVAAFVCVEGVRRDGEKRTYLPGPAIYGSHVHAKFHKGGDGQKTN